MIGKQLICSWPPSSLVILNKAPKGPTFVGIAGDAVALDEETVDDIDGATEVCDWTACASAKLVITKRANKFFIMSAAVLKLKFG